MLGLMQFLMNRYYICLESKPLLTLYAGMRASSISVNICLTNLHDIFGVTFRRPNTSHGITKEYSEGEGRSSYPLDTDTVVSVDLSKSNYLSGYKIELIAENLAADNFFDTKPVRMKNHRKIISKRSSILQMNGALTLEPNRELVFEGILDKPISSTVRLTNDSIDNVYFHVRAASSDLQIRPDSGILKSGEKEEITVFWKPMEWNYTDVLRDRIIIKSSRMYNGQSFKYGEW
ncbi:unnamed protein product [Dicrocoelium dendriticum]|nr:unnamed protein product [Dicrocoelium dendriticum]